MKGWIKSYRSIVEWEWFDDPYMVKLYIFLLHTANYENSTWKGISVKKGQTVIGLKSLSAKLKMSVQRLRTCLSKLKMSGEINIQSTNKYSIVTINNYCKFQSREETINTQTNKRATNKQHINNTHSNKQNEELSTENNSKSESQDEKSNTQTNTLLPQKSTTLKEVKNIRNNNILSSKLDVESVKDNSAGKSKDEIPYQRIINYLNKKTGRKFKVVDAHKRKIKARFNDGHTAEDFKCVIDNKCQDWASDPKMSKYLRPDTLFGTKFDSYLNDNVQARKLDDNVVRPGFYRSIPQSQWTPAERRKAMM